MKAAFRLWGLCFLCWTMTPIGCAQTTLQVNSDGTASVTGKVEQNFTGCVADGACYLRLAYGKSEIRIYYDPGETEAPIPNGSLVPQLMKVEPGAIISAYGAHRQTGRLHMIDVYSRAEYFVHILPNVP
jgi:hypothetical protein